MAAQEPAEGDKALWRRWRSWLIVSGTVLATLALLALALVVLPPLLVPPGNPSFADLAKAESDIRGNLVAALGILAVLIGGMVGFLNFRETQRQNRVARQREREQLELTRRGQVNERFSKAIEQLGQAGDDKVDVRIGAIYSLEQIARDSPEELHGPVIEMLTAFLRGHSSPQEQKPCPDEQEAGPPAASVAGEAYVRLRADFEAIATVLGRRDRRRDTRRLDLNRVDLRGVILDEPHLERANLNGAHLEKANLTGAHLERAFLGGAHLEEAHLRGAHLEHAFLGVAHLEHAFLGDAHLEGTTLVGAHLEGANLSGAHLEEANLTGAHLEGAKVNASGLTLEQVAVAHCDESTKVPAYLQEPASMGES